MKLWKIKQNENSDYDTYDSAVVASESEDDARTIMPDGRDVPDGNHCESMRQAWQDTGWAKPEYVKVEYIGEAKEGTKRGPICASFNAG